MKFKVKGLVFVGFAAAILSANAMAAGDNTVTSKSYVDNKFQTIANLSTQGDSTGNQLNANSDTTYPSEKMVAAALTATGNSIGNGTISVTQNGQSAGSFTTNQNGNGSITIAAPDWTAASNEAGYIVNKPTVDTTFNATSNNAATSSAIADYVADQLAGDPAVPGSGYQNESTANYQIGTADGGWTTLNAGLADGTYTTKSESNGIVTFDVDATTDGTLAAAGTGGADEGKIPTAGAVKTYVDSKATSAASNILASTQDGTDTGHALTNAATTTALAGKQALQSGDTYQVSKNGSWTAANGAVADSGTHITTTNEADGSVIINVSDTTNVASGITSTSTSLTEGKAVYEYVNTVNNGQAFPAQPTAQGETCDADHPCALVNDNGTISWKRIAQATDNVGA